MSPSFFRMSWAPDLHLCHFWCWIQRAGASAAQLLERREGPKSTTVTDDIVAACFPTARFMSLLPDVEGIRWFTKPEQHRQRSGSSLELTPCDLVTYCPPVVHQHSWLRSPSIPPG